MKQAYCILYMLTILWQMSGCSSPAASSSTTDASGSASPDTYRYVVAADPQLFRGKQEDFDKAIRLINQVKPKFVIMCGDLVETPGNPSQIQAYLDCVSNLLPETVLYHVPGNHDLGHPVTKNHIETYQAHFGKLWYQFSEGNNLFIVLCSDILSDQNAPLHKQQMEWLTDTLQRAQSEDADGIYVFMHHPLYIQSPDEADGYSNMPLAIRRTLLNLFVDYGVRAVFSGHLHDNKTNHYQSVDLITTSSITVPMGKSPSGFRIITINEDGGYEDAYYVIE